MSATNWHQLNFPVIDFDLIRKPLAYDADLLKCIRKNLLEPEYSFRSLQFNDMPESENKNIATAPKLNKRVNDSQSKSSFSEQDIEFKPKVKKASNKPRELLPTAAEITPSNATEDTKTVENKNSEAVFRIWRENTFPGTRFVNLDEIPNIRYRLNYASFQTTKLLLQMIEIVLNTEKESSPSSSSSKIADHITSQSSVKRPSSAEVINVDSDSTSDRTALTNKVLQYGGISLHCSAATKEMAYFNLLDFTDSLASTDIIYLAGVLGLTILMPQPAHIHRLRALDGSMVQIREPRFK